MSDKIYRLRPVDDNTLDELSNNYLWFSLPSGFKGDVEDANIGLFIENNDILQRAFSKYFGDNQLEEFSYKMERIGICCFTKKLPSAQDRSHFPNGKKSLCIEYNKDLLINHFKEKLYLPNCFKEVLYTDLPMKLETDGEYHILMRKDETGEYYDSIYRLKFDHSFIDKLLYLLLTRINMRFCRQSEERIIWAGRNIDTNVESGYKICIPKDCIEVIHIYQNTPRQYVEKLKGLGYKIGDVII